MKSETIDVQQVFQERRQYRVPFYQRAYVWAKEEQWEPLWNDIQGKADSRILGNPSHAHFLGAIVLEPQYRGGLRGVEAHHIIDGQQRLTTLQYFLAALSMSLREHKVTSISTVIEGCRWNANSDTMEHPEIERFKVWPTFRDRDPYTAAMQSSNERDLRSRFPSSFTQSGTLKKIGVDHPAALEAIWFFNQQIEVWLEDKNNEMPVAQKLERLAEAVLRDLRFVSISLGEEDDAQVIFETLNGRGAELHATDLIRNFIFMRADQDGAATANLYDTLWTPFESTFWIEEQRRGRLKRPRLEWFVQTALQAELADPIDVGSLYASYRRFAGSGAKPMSAEQQLRTLTKHSDQYRQLISGTGSDPISIFGKRIAVWDVSPTHPVALRVATAGIEPKEQQQIFDDILSYVVRRAVCGMTTKNYNNIFLQLLKRLRTGGTNAEEVHAALSVLDGSASRWPTDDEFRRAWLTASFHENLAEPARIRYILTELENGLRSARSEEPFVPVAGMLDVDHILPDKWYEHWPIAGDAITSQEAASAEFAIIDSEKPSPRIAAINRREKLKATIGNLTLVHYGVNRSLQNGPFEKKREAFFQNSNLSLNRNLMRAETWEETSIELRGRELFDVAQRIWRGPEK